MKASYNKKFVRDRLSGRFHSSKRTAFAKWHGLLLLSVVIQLLPHAVSLTANGRKRSEYLRPRAEKNGFLTTMGVENGVLSTKREKEWCTYDQERKRMVYQGHERMFFILFFLTKGVKNGVLTNTTKDVKEWCTYKNRPRM